MNEVFTRPSVTVGIEWLSEAFQWPKEDTSEFRDLSAQYKKGIDLISSIRSEVQAAKQAEKKAYSDVVANPSTESVAKAEKARQAASAAEAGMSGSIKHVEAGLNNVTPRLAVVAARLNRALGDHIIEQSRQLEHEEKSTAQRFGANQYVPSETVRALVYLAARFFSASDTLPKTAISYRQCSPDSSLNGVFPPAK